MIADPSFFPAQFEAAHKAHRKAISTFARNCVRQLPAMDTDDIEQELLIIMWKCIQNYDPDKGASFKTHFFGSAVNRIRTLIRAAQTQKRSSSVQMYSINDEDFNEAVLAHRSEASAEEWYMAIEEFGATLVEAAAGLKVRRAA